MQDKKNNYYLAEELLAGIPEQTCIKGLNLQRWLVVYGVEVTMDSSSIRSVLD